MSQNSILSLSSSPELRQRRTEETSAFAESYNSFTVTVAKYPTDISALVGNVTAGVLYTAIGIANEVGELAEHFDQEAMRSEYSAERYQKAWGELGDVQWYIARLCAEMPGVLPTFAELVQTAMEKLAAEDFRDVRISGYDLQSSLCAAAGRVLGVVKKMMRDGALWDDEKRRAKQIELRDSLYAMVCISTEFAERTGPLVGCEGGYMALLEANRDKLAGRNERGTLQGDGDVR